MDLSPEARLGLCSPRRHGRSLALDEGSSLDVDAGRCLSLLLEECRRQLALPARHEKRTTDLLRVEGIVLPSGQALSFPIGENFSFEIIGSRCWVENSPDPLPPSWFESKTVSKSCPKYSQKVSFDYTSFHHEPFTYGIYGLRHFITNALLYQLSYLGAFPVTMGILTDPGVAGNFRIYQLCQFL